MPISDRDQLDTQLEHAQKMLDNSEDLSEKEFWKREKLSIEDALGGVEND